MADKFDGSDHLDLQPGDSNVPQAFRFNPSTASTANTGAIPYGSTLMSSTAFVHRHDDTSVDASTALIVSKTVSSNTVTVYLQHSTMVPPGQYDLVVKPTFSLTGSATDFTRQYDFDRIFLKNR